MTKKKVVEKEEVVEETKEKSVYISSNQQIDFVVPGIPGIVVLKSGENKIEPRGDHSALELAQSIIRDHFGDRPGLSLTLIER